MKHSLLAAVLISATASAGCAAPRYLARVNEEEITGQDLKREFGRRHRSFEKYLAAETEVRMVLDAIIDRKLFLQEARQAGIQDDPALREELRELRERKMIELLVKREIDEPSKATEQEMQAAYEKIGEAGLAREVVTVTRAEAEEVRTRALVGEDVETLARERSIAPSRLNGGLFVLRWGDLQQVREEAGFALQAGDISPVFETNVGWTVLKLEERKPVERPPLAKVSMRLRGVIERRKVEALDREFIARLRAKYAVEMLPCDLSLASLEKARSSKDETICATWTGGSFTLSDLASRVKLDRLRAVPAVRQDAEIQVGVGDVIAERLLLAEATARGLGEDPSIVEALLSQEENMLVDLYLERYVTQEVTVSDEEIDEQYEARKAEFVVPESRLLAQTIVGDPEALAEVQRRLAAGESFEAVASDTSKNESQRRQGGMVGWTERKDVPESFGPVFTARTGEVLDPLTAPDGIHVIKVLDIRPAKPIERPEAEKEIKDELLTKRRMERFRRFLGELRSHADIEVSDAAIRKYLRDNPLPVVKPAPVMEGSGDAPGGHGGAGGGMGGHGGSPPAGHGGAAGPPPAAPAPPKP